MTTVENARDRLGTPHRRIPVRYVPVLVTLSLVVAMFTAGSLHYPYFGTGQVFLNLFVDNSFLLVAVVGMTFVILTGGIDLSVGSVVALSTLLCAELAGHGWPAYAVFPVVLLVGATLGLAMGSIIHFFEIQPFIVTLAGMFLARGLCYAITVDAISITNPSFTRIAGYSLALPWELFLTMGAVLSLVVVAIGLYFLHLTSFGRTVYAIGGNRQSAVLMGLPVARTEVLVYTISGTCSALGGILLSFYMLSGSGSLAVGMELDAIAAVVIGGTLLTGGTGYLLGSLLGVLVLGLIKTLITFQGTLSSWWTKIVVGLLLLAFILLQRLVFHRQAVSKRVAACRSGYARAGDGARTPGARRSRVKTVLNVIWLVLAGLWLALGYLLAAILLAITIVGLPFAKQSLKLARYALWPFGWALVESPNRMRTLSAVGNVLWFVLAGWWLALVHLVSGIALCLTIVGIPLGIADIKMAGAALVPFGRSVVRAHELNAGMVAADSTIAMRD